MVLHEILAPGLQEQFFEGATKRIRRNFILLKDTRYLDNTNLISQKNGVLNSGEEVHIMSTFMILINIKEKKKHQYLFSPW